VRSHAKAPSVGSVWIASAAATVFAVALLALALLAPSASAYPYGATSDPATNIQKTSADLNGAFVNFGQEAHYYFEWGETEAYGHTTPLPPGAAISPIPYTTMTVPPITISGLDGATAYHYRLVVTDSEGTATGNDATFTTPSVANLRADAASAVTDHSAELNASFDGDGSYETHYYFEWGPTTGYGNTTPVPPGNAVAPGSGRINVPPVPITGLIEGATYHFRVVASNSLGTTVSSDRTFNAAEAPSVGGISSRKVTASSAELVGEVNPHSAQTSYHFEWGNTTAYGNSIPVPDAGVGSGTSPVPVAAQLEGLSAGVTYHFRLVATNQYGTTRSVDQSFGFYPPACPNAQVRQETRSNTLPDCRAYELASPSFAQGALIMPLDGPNSGLATNPARLAYGTVFGLLPEETGEPINSTGDLYVSTRTSTGWFQKYIGRGGSQTQEMGGPPVNVTASMAFKVDSSRNQLGTQVSPQMDKIIDYDRGWPGGLGQLGEPSNAPYVWDSSTGKLLERWPSNLAQIEGGMDFVGVPQASADFSHFVFSSNLVFADGGEHSDQEIVCDGCAGTDPGGFPELPKASVYDNDLATGAVVLASRREDGTPFQGYVFDVSDDGSHILMGDEPPAHSTDPIYQAPANSHVPAEVLGPLYLRIDAQRTVEIAPGRHIRYIGGTADGSTAYLTSDEQLSADDHDSSTDLYVWRQSEPEKLTLVSVGPGGTGNGDACSASWVSGCGVVIIQFESYAKVPGGEGGNSVSDNFIASKSGDIYFESPEQLVTGKGDPDQVNLYLYREGTVRYVTTMRPGTHCQSIEFVGTYCSDGPVARMQVTPDGSHMAMVTDSNLTSYDGASKLEMYTFDPQSGRVTCASCRPDGEPPVSDVHASQNGLFQTDDGRVFFSTEDALVPRDTNQAIDVYEYTEGKASLISSGLAPKVELLTALVPQNAPGLVSVSANGTDVYFATRDTLVTQDHNGEEFKIYDARTGGGFPAERVESKCPSADECHGPGAAQPALPADRTSAGLGRSRKPQAHRKAHKHKKHRKKRSGKAKKAHRASKAKQGRSHHG
jgi:hypothetical protein